MGKVRVCLDCQEPVTGLSDGHDEIIDYCEACERVVEGNTETKEVENE